MQLTFLSNVWIIVKLLVGKEYNPILVTAMWDLLDWFQENNNVPSCSWPSKRHSFISSENCTVYFKLIVSKIQLASFILFVCPIF